MEAESSVAFRVHAGVDARLLRALSMELALGLLLLLGLPCLARPQTPDEARSRALALSDEAWELARDGTEQSLRESIRKWWQAAELFQADGSHMDEGIVFQNIGDAYRILGQPDSAIAYFRRSSMILKEVDDPQIYPPLGEALFKLAIVQQGRDPDGAIETLNAYVDVMHDAGQDSRVARGLNQIGIVYGGLGRIELALSYYRRALPIYETQGPLNELGNAVHNIAGALDALGHTDSALVTFHRALRIRRMASDSIGEGFTLHDIGGLFYGLAQPDSALAYYRAALKIRKRLGHRQLLALTLNGLGVTHEDLGNLDSARAYYKESLPLRRAAGDTKGVAVTLANLGYLNHLNHPQDLETAVAYYDSAAAARAAVATSTRADASRVAVAEAGTPLFEAWPLAWLGRAEEVGTQPARLSALAAAERGRAQALLELRRGGTEVAPGADLEAEGRRLIAPLVESGTPGIVYLVTHDTLVSWLILPSGRLHVSRAFIPRDTLAALVAWVRQSLGVDARAPRVDSQGREGGRRRLPVIEPPPDGRGVRALGDAGPWPNVAARNLAELLLPIHFLERLPQSGELVLSPHSFLNLLPFAALPVGEADEPLGVRYALRYSPSLAILGEIQRGPETGGSPLVVGNPAMPAVATHDGTRMQLPQLPGAESEAVAVGELLGARPLVGEAATEDEVRRRLPHATIVHLATHGYAFASDTMARDSWIALAPGPVAGGADAGSDGLLTVGELLYDAAPQLTADLVVLSACQTGLGDLKLAEGTVGLERAFLARGARSVLVSLWSVDDEATRALMQAFYRHWRDGDPPSSKPEALRSAQMDLRRSGYEDPRYWAAYKLVGAR